MRLVVLGHAQQNRVRDLRSLLILAVVIDELAARINQIQNDCVIDLKYWPIKIRIEKIFRAIFLLCNRHPCPLALR